MYLLLVAFSDSLLQDALNALEQLRDRDIAHQFGAAQSRRSAMVSHAIIPQPPVAPAGTGAPSAPIGRLNSAGEASIHRRTSNTAFSV